MMKSMDPEILKGFLSKRGTSVFRAWKKRFFVFEKGVMKYYSTYPYDENNLKRVVSLHDYKIENKEGKVIYLWSESDNSRDYFLVPTESRIDLSEWCAIIADHIEFSKECQRNSLVIANGENLNRELTGMNTDDIEHK